ncbi:MAG: response regulator [Anaerolineales bacterium]|nr:response regulator [Anaerolineales bacterium]MCB0004856.1 response regulator [Anaerolineales bacterium]MCB0010345.1 response regulator [Anaerolineales bacterium]MCB0016876.1 response regulator [Anaerolineales bacterium]MCB8962431.1 response regulator [Ardenticatenales bacterium]
MKILYIEDNPFNMQLVEKVLRASGYELLAAEDGEKGLALAREHEPELILLDINLPGMGGYEIAQKIRECDLPGLASVPIIAVTANALVGDDEKAIEAGCTDYLAKPINIRELRETVARYLNAVTT